MNEHEGKEVETEQCLERILNSAGVQGYVIADEMGLKQTKNIENTTALQYSALFWDVTMQVKSLVRDLDPTNELLFFRINTKRNEALTTLANDELIIVVQKLSQHTNNN